MHAKKLLAHKFDPFPAVTLSEFCLFAPAILHTITPRRHKKTGHCVRFVIV
ncbi:S-adenosylmethionine tRNA ribosyltransferase, partial [Salmonella enterica]|nr:S-adenosylmethionine tRNA ribosyltransferase [Salmonella enterica]